MVSTKHALKKEIRFWKHPNYGRGPLCDKYRSDDCKGCPLTLIGQKCSKIDSLWKQIDKNYDVDEREALIENLLTILRFLLKDKVEPRLYYKVLGDDRKSCIMRTWCRSYPKFKVVTAYNKSRLLVFKTLEQAQKFVDTDSTFRTKKQIIVPCLVNDPKKVGITFFYAPRLSLRDCWANRQENTALFNYSIGGPEGTVGGTQILCLE